MIKKNLPFGCAPWLSGSACVAPLVVEAHIEDFDFSFEGPFGAFDTNQLATRSGKSIPRSALHAHGMKKFVPIRTADDGGLNYPEDQVRAYAGEL